MREGLDRFQEVRSAHCAVISTFERASCPKRPSVRWLEFANRGEVLFALSEHVLQPGPLRAGICAARMAEPVKEGNRDESGCKDYEGVLALRSSDRTYLIVFRAGSGENPVRHVMCPIFYFRARRQLVQYGVRYASRTPPMHVSPPNACGVTRL